MIIYRNIKPSVQGERGYCLELALNSPIIYNQIRSSPSGILKMEFLSVIEFIICMDNSAMYEVQCLEEFRLLFDPNERSDHGPREISLVNRDFNYFILNTTL